MFVRKFEADTLEDALKAVKVELGPDAIILKTVTNKGLRSSFKRKKFEITAAITESNYINKAKVDNVLSDEQRQQFYNSEASHVSKMIKHYNGDREMSDAKSNAGGYGSLGLNKMVTSLNAKANDIKEFTQKTSSRVRSSLDEFLSDDVESEVEENSIQQLDSVDLYADQDDDYDDYNAIERSIAAPSVSNTVNSELKSLVELQQQKIQELEKKFADIESRNIDERKQSGLYQLRTTLKTLDLDENIILKIIKKAQFELSKNDIEDQDIIFEFALRELHNMINVSMPQYADRNIKDTTFTILISEVATGQTTMALKLAAAQDNAVVLSFDPTGQSKPLDFSSKMLGVEVEKVSTIAQAVSFCRKMSSEGKRVFIDYKGDRNSDETKKFIETLKRSFKNIEVILNISAIHSEIYNRKVVQKHQEIIDGVTISHLDLCMNYGALVNIHVASQSAPLVFFGTGPVVPEDVEFATAERILSGMFEF